LHIATLANRQSNRFVPLRQRLESCRLVLDALMKIGFDPKIRGTGRMRGEG
jgi:hypothetical protein